jgi:hypothetical protein
MIRALVVALVIPVLVTGATLASVARNRSSARAPMELSERELSVARRDDNQTAATLWLSWHARPWPNLRSEDYRALPRRGYVALELNGPAFAALSLPRDGERQRVSRLVVVDADVDPGVLEARYPDGRTHIITSATLRPLPGRPLRDSLVMTIEPQRLHVPREWAARLPPPRTFERDGLQPFTAEVRYGARYEPWVTRIRIP